MFSIVSSILNIFLKSKVQIQLLQHDLKVNNSMNK